MRLIIAVSALALAACGPKANPGDDGSTGPGETGGASEGGATSPSTTDVPTSAPDPSDPTTPPTTAPEPTTLTTSPGPVSTVTTEPPPDPSTSTSGSTGDDDTTTGCQFIGCPSDLPPIECDVFVQDCPIGQKCSAWANDGGSAWNATKCVPVSRDPHAPGEPCTVEGSAVSGIDDCDVGVMCFFVDVDTNTGLCVELCAGSLDAPSCSPGKACQISNDDVLNLCLETCDPEMPTCPEGQTCVPTPDASVCMLL
jgi:hypothetical protein